MPATAPMMPSTWPGFRMTCTTTTPSTGTTSSTWTTGAPSCMMRVSAPVPSAVSVSALLGLSMSEAGLFAVDSCCLLMPTCIICLVMPVWNTCRHKSTKQTSLRQACSSAGDLQAAFALVLCCAWSALSAECLSGCAQLRGPVTDMFVL